MTGIPWPGPDAARGGVGVRAARPEDRDRILAWRNNPVIVGLGASQRTVAREEHEAWFQRVLDRSREHLLYVIVADGEDAGVVRFDRTGEDAAIITVYVVPERIGRGVGASATRHALAACFEAWPALEVVRAEVRCDNARALKAFRGYGFAPGAAAGGLAVLALGRGDFVRNLWLPEWDVEREATSRRYDANVRRDGATLGALEWGSRASQERRFEVLAAGLEDGMRVLDVGCGLGDFLDWIRRRGRRIDYAGIDVSREMVQAAVRRFPGVRFAEGDIRSAVAAGPFDAVLASGIFAFSRAHPELFVETVARRMFDACRAYAAFNLLSQRAERREPGEYYADPARCAGMAASITRRFSLRHDYHPGDFSVILERESRT